MVSRFFGNQFRDFTGYPSADLTLSDRDSMYLSDFLINSDSGYNSTWKEGLLLGTDEMS
jgi:hypothetical protein